MYIASFVLRE